MLTRKDLVPIINKEPKRCMNVNEEILFMLNDDQLTDSFNAISNRKIEVVDKNIFAFSE
jgi:hypothetical protein